MITDEDDGIVSQSLDDENSEQSAEVLYWCEKWRLVIGKILQRDIELISPKISAANPNGVKSKNNKKPPSEDSKDQPSSSSLEFGNNGGSKDDAFAFIQLTDDEYNTLRAKCIESLSTSHGRVAFSLIINRQRNTEYGLELQPSQFNGLVELIHLFLDSVQQSQPLDIKPAKLVMIMSQSLYVKKTNMLQNGGMTDEESKEEIQKMEEMQQQLKEQQNNGNGLHRRKSTNAFAKNDKLFVVDRVKNHAVWKNDKFWKEAYCDSVQQEILKYPPVKKWHSEQEQQEAERREEQIIFSQLAAWTHNMKEFGTEEAKIVKFLDTRGLKQEKVDMLKLTLQLKEETHSPMNGSPMSSQDTESAKMVGSFQTEDSLISQELP